MEHYIKTLERNRKKTWVLRKINSIKHRIVFEGIRYASDNDHRLILLQEIEKIDKFASMDIIQKAHIKWDIEGDENSKFFHGLINQKRRNQMINGIMVEGNWITNPCLIKDAFLQFYKRKFQAQDSQVMFSNLPHSHSLNCMDRAKPLRMTGYPWEIKEAVWGLEVHGNSRAFIAGRQILDGPVILSEIIECFGFGNKWCSWIKACLNSSRASILINGSPEAVGNGLITGVNIKNSTINVSHLFYADDVIITTDWNAKDMDNIIRVLHVFYLASGLKINIHKSNIYGIGVNKDEVLSMASNAGCIAGDIPFNYLGLPIGSNMKSIASWKTLVDRFHMRLSSWKANLLSIGGRLTLIKSVLGSSSYLLILSIFRAPESVLPGKNLG
ncbi:hypothetical protein Tco_0857301 [Tanacetum coccineum]|uniref:Reverse transcriptase domain-containing protein n=1 Tax=Tanacetum coccineum TaxID=301880 RepID=A0ABQ5BA49_9ASTR